MGGVGRCQRGVLLMRRYGMSVGGRAGRAGWGGGGGGGGGAGRGAGRTRRRSRKKQAASAAAVDSSAWGVFGRRGRTWACVRPAGSPRRPGLRSGAPAAETICPRRSGPSCRGIVHVRCMDCGVACYPVLPRQPVPPEGRVAANTHVVVSTEPNDSTAADRCQDTAGC